MAARVLVARDAVDRLAEMGLTPQILERAVLRAEAEAATTTAFDPPVTEGSTRYFKTVRFLREELVPNGWDYDNPKNFCRVINPERTLAIATSSGDAVTGDPEYSPTTKNPKGYATAQAVGVNGQLAFDFVNTGEGVSETDDDEQLATWFLLYHRTETEIRVELSLPNEMTGANVSRWDERIILPPFSLDSNLLTAALPDEGDDGIVVEVNRR